MLTVSMICSLKTFSLASTSSTSTGLPQPYHHHLPVVVEPFYDSPSLASTVSHERVRLCPVRAPVGNVALARQLD